MASPDLRTEPAPSVRSASLTIAGERIELLPERAAWWPAARTLFVADLHLGKEAAYRWAGVPMPDGVLDEALRRLEHAIAATGAERLVVLGDLVHARRGLDRSVVERVAAFRERCPCRLELVQGNHDRPVRELPPSWSVAVRAEGEPDGPFLYRHEPEIDLAADVIEQASPAPYVLWSGHLHPTVRVVGATLPAFVITPTAVILPAFTSFSRGPGVRPIPGRRIFAVADGSVIELTR